MTDSNQPHWHDAVLGQSGRPSGPTPTTDAVLGGNARSAPNWTWGQSGDRQVVPPPKHSLQGVIQQCHEADREAAIFCHLSPDFTFRRSATAMSAPRHRAHVITTQHRQVALLWGFHAADRRTGAIEQRIWYNLFYFQTGPLQALLRSVEVGFVYWQLGETVKADWEYHFATAFGRCPIVPNSHHIMAHMAQFYPAAYAAAYATWQTRYDLTIPLSRQRQLQQSAIDAVIDLANYYLWFQIQL
jgi:hypothetical protein